MQRTLEWPGEHVVTVSSARTNLPFVLAPVALLTASTALNLVSGHSSTPTALLFDPTLAQPLARVLSGLALMISVCVVGLHLYSRRGVPSAVPYVWGSYGALALSDILGVVHGVPLGQFTSLFVITALLMLASRVDSVEISRTIRNSLAVYAVLNVLGLVVLPSYAIQQDYEGLMGLRLHGLANHANSLAPYMLLLLVTLVLRPFRQPLFTATIGVLALVLLLATQSKTTLIMLAVLALFTVPGFMRRLGAQTRLGLTLAIVPLTVAGFGLALVTSGSLDALLSNDDVTSLTSRDIVWQTTLDAWRLDPVMGYGAEGLWNEEMGQAFATQYGWQPRYAHNQWLQVLGQAGLVGMGALLGLMAFLVRSAWRANHSVKLMLLGLLLTFFGIRGISEAPIGGGLFADNTVLQTMIMLLILGFAARTTRKVIK